MFGGFIENNQFASSSSLFYSLSVFMENISMVAADLLSSCLDNGAVLVEIIMADALLMFVAVSCIVPALLLIGLFSGAVALSIYLNRSRVLGLSAEDGGIVDRARTLVATIADTQGTFFNGFDVNNLDSIPDQGGAVLVLYHGALPLDFYYLWARVQLAKRRTMWQVADRFMWRIPGIGPILDILHAVKGTPSECIKLLKSGHIVVLSPGGMREAQFSDSMYKLLWGRRCGFARIAKEAGVPVIPVFCRNIREAVHTFPWRDGVLRSIYERIRIPVVPVYGPWPVKLRCYIGEHMSSPPEESAEDYAQRVRVVLEDMIEQHQQRPGRTVRALMERWTLPSIES